MNPDVPFPKDTELVKVSGFRMLFESGMVLVGSREHLDERVQMPSGEDEGGVLVNDALKSLKGR